MNTVNRPQPGENEEDLLRQQQDFMKQSLKPSASVVNKRKGERQSISKFAKSSRKSQKKHINSPINSVLGNIKEKIPEFASWTFSHSGGNQGFPETFTRDETLCHEGTSIFSQHISVTSHESTNSDSVHTQFQMTSEEVANAVGSKSFILCGSDSMKIHEENVKKLSEMSMDEICAEQRKLRETLDPNLLQFLLSHRQKYKLPPNNEEMSLSEVHCDKNETHLENALMDKSSIVDDFVGAKSQFVKISENSSNWLHMNIVEDEKLQWVGDIPVGKPLDRNQAYNARFDFQGLLLPYMSKEVDVRQGLYHHGNEPERPGYSFEELYQLSRSSILQQRVVALNIISNILEKAKKGYYDSCFNESLLSRLLDHELFLLLRFALDDNTEIQLVAALYAMKNLLCSDIDEFCLDRILGCRRGIWQPSLCVVHNIPKNKENELKETEAELKDYEIMKVDIIKGALRTDIIPRIRYILEVLQPDPKAVIYCLEILTRLARHSYDTALAITCCPRLIQVIMTNFIPKDWKTMVGEVRPSDMKSVYGVPLVEALKFLRIVACQSRKIASDLIYKYSVMESVISYVSVDPRECSLPLQEVLRLSLESFYIWKTFLAYHLTVAHFIDLYPVLMRLLHFHCTATTVEDDSSLFSHEHGTALISLIEQAVFVACCQSSKEHLDLRTLGYQHVRDFSGILELCLSKWLVQLGGAVTPTFAAMKLVGATMNCLASLYSYHLSQSDFDTVSFLSDLEHFFESKILIFLKSDGYKRATANMKSCSCLLFTGELGSKRDPFSLPSLGCMMWEGKCSTPLIETKSPVGLLSGLFNFMLAAYTAHKGLDIKYINGVMEDLELIHYVKSINKHASAKLGSHWFTRLEVRMLACLLKLTFVKNFHFDMYHCLAFKLVTLVQRDEKYLVHDIMSQIVFNGDFFQNYSRICKSMTDLHLETSFERNVSKKDLIQKAIHELPALWNSYRKYLNIEINPSVHEYSNLISLTGTKRGTELLLPIDWPYLPVVYLHKQEKSVQQADIELTTIIITTLQWVFLVEELQPDVAAAISPTDRFCRLSAVFLCGSDLFLDPVINELLFASLNGLMKEYKKIKFPSSFYDLYTQLLEQFAAVSYGDRLFGQFLLVPLQQRHSPELRKQVWSEHASVLRVLSTPVNQLLFPLSEMLEPCEMDSSLLMTYLQCLATETVREIWSPVLYLVAVHHVATFINLHSHTELAEHMKSKISKLGNKELQSLLFHYQESSFLATR